LDSIISQTYKNWECIVVDDGSADNTLAILNKCAKKDTRFKIFKRPPSALKGACSCRNYGFKMCKGEYVVWFDSDDLMVKDYIEKQYNNCINNDALFSVCKFSTFTNDDTVILKKSRLVGENLLEDFITKRIKINTPSIFYDKTILKNMKYDKTLVKAQDLDFIYRILLTYGKSGCVLDEVLVQIRIHDNRITSLYNNFKLKPLLSSIEVKWRILRDAYGTINHTAIKEVKKIFILELRLILFRGNFGTFFKYINKARTNGFISKKECFFISGRYLLQSLYKIPKGIFKRSKAIKTLKNQIKPFVKK